MSVLGKKWVVKAENCGKPILDILLENRGILTEEEKKKFLDEDDTLELHDPFLLNGMQKTVDRIMDAIKKKERIMIFGDYDVDGITSTAIMYHALKKLDANFSARLPNREKDGYGLSKKFIDEFAESDVKLIITVDCGISCNAEVTYALEKGIETIITDHHSIPENIPKDAHSINHPKLADSSYPFADLTGAGVALKVAHALFEHNFGPEKAISDIEPLLELAGLGTIADIGIAHGENRLIIKKGLRNLLNTSYPGIRILKEFAGIKEVGSPEISALTVGFQIAPRINAACRIGDPYTALKILINEDEALLYDCARELEELNQKRQKMTEETFAEAFDKFDTLGHDGKLPYILIAESSTWHVGIIGLAASRLAERFNRPAIVMQDFGDTLTASARSIQGFDIIEALSEFKDLLITFGGHKEAAGLSIEKKHLQEFKEKMEAYTDNKLKNKDLRQTLNIDCELKPECINDTLIEEIWKLKPFGVRNSRPLFVVKNVKPHFIDSVGRNKNHVKFTAEIEKNNFPVIGFKLGEHVEKIKNQKSFDIVCHIDYNFWNGQKVLQLELIDFQ